MRAFPTRIPIGAILGTLSALATAPLIYAIWRHSFSALESFYLGTYVKASCLPSRTLLTNRPMLHKFWVVTVNGHYATPAIMPPTMQGVSGKLEDLVPSSFATWLRTAVYHGRPAGDLIATPLIIWAVCVAVLIVAGFVYDFKRKQRARDGEQLRGPERLTIEEFNRTTKVKREEQGFALRTKA